MDDSCCPDDATPLRELADGRRQCPLCGMLQRASGTFFRAPEFLSRLFD